MQRRALHGCGGREAPFGLDGLGNVAAKNQGVRCGAVLPPVARPSSRSARERAWCGVVSEGRRELAPCDAEGDNRANYCAGLGKERRCELTWLRGGGARHFFETEPVYTAMVWGPRAGVGIRGRTQRSSGFGVTPGNKQKHKQVESLQKVGVDEAHAPTEVSALPRVHLDPIFVGSHNSISGARRSL